MEEGTSHGHLIGRKREMVETGKEDGTIVGESFDVRASNTDVVHRSRIDRITDGSVTRREYAPVVCAALGAMEVEPKQVSHVHGPSIHIMRKGKKQVEVKAEFSFRAEFETEQEVDSVLGSEGGERDNEGSFSWLLDPDGMFPNTNNGGTIENRQSGRMMEESAAEPNALQTRSTLWEIDIRDIDVKKRISVGGFAEVFLAQYHGTAVAIKRFLSEEDDFARQQFQTEVALLARLRHPNLILFMGYTVHPYLSIMSEYMSRGSLFDVLRRQRGKPLDLDKQRVVALSVARGMAYLHSRKSPILHLDLKSPNILVDERWRVKITDFGLSRVRKRTYVSSAGGEGTPEWMAPELLRNEPFDEKADVYSFGVVIWEICTGQLPWEELRPMQVVGAVGFQGRQLPSPSDGDPLLLKLHELCCNPSSASRPTFKEILRMLEDGFARYMSKARSRKSLEAGPKPSEDETIQEHHPLEKALEILEITENGLRKPSSKQQRPTIE